MIDPKYADLPGIAYDQPDCYETDDVSEDNRTQEFMPEDVESVEKIYINPSDAYNKFKDKYISSRDIDFSDTISTKSKTGYNICAGEWELSYRDKNETPLERYNRIKYEMKELQDEIQTLKVNLKENEDPKSLLDILSQIENTGKELNAMNIEKLLGGNAVSSLSNYHEIRIKELQSQIEIFKQKNTTESSVPKKEVSAAPQDSAKSGTLKYQMIYHPDKAKVQDIARMSNLEKRLGHLESLIGISDDSTAKCSQVLRSQGIMKSIEKLMANACLLNSAQLDVLENKVTSLLHKMDTVSQKKAASAQDTKHEKTVSELYELVKQTENCSQVLPQTIDRLLALSSLHKKAADFATQLKDLEELEADTRKSLLNNETLLQEIQKNFSGNLEIIAKDITALNDRISKLKK